MCIYAMFLLKNDISNEVEIYGLYTHHYELPFKTPDSSPWWNMIAFPLGIALYFSFANFQSVVGKEPKGFNPTITIKHHLRMTLFLVKMISLMFFELILLIGSLTVLICGELGPGGGILSALAVAIEMFALCYFLAGPLVFSFMAFMDGYDYEKSLTENYVDQIVVLFKEGVIIMITFIIGTTVIYLLETICSSAWKIVESIKRIKISIK